MKSLFSKIVIASICSSCNLFHAQESFELEKLSDDVLGQKSGRGISITVIPIEEVKNK